MSANIVMLGLRTHKSMAEIREVREECVGVCMSVRGCVGARGCGCARGRDAVWIEAEVPKAPSSLPTTDPPIGSQLSRVN